MTRTEAIATVESNLDSLSNERLQVLAEFVQSWSQPTVFSTLSADERAKLDDAVDSLERGEGVSLEIVEAELEARLKAAGV